MKFGLKDYQREDILDQYAKKADFLEVQGLRNKNYDFIKKYKIPIVVHAEHFSLGINPANPKIRQQNLDSLNQAIKISDIAKGKKIIYHPGDLRDPGCTEEIAIEFIKNIKDKRIMLENMPGITSERLCRTSEQTEKFLKQTNKHFIFDLAHCMITANKLKIPQLTLIKQFLKLKPIHFHISGQDTKSIKDEHLALTNCDINWKEILALYPKDAEITLEVSRDVEKTLEDLEMIREIAKSIN
jgi:sugar phosphate isomerase/epimerase